MDSDAMDPGLGEESCEALVHELLDSSERDQIAFAREQHQVSM
jgi:hypothetical protein